MTATPWGTLAHLRARRLPPGPKQDRAAVTRHQRERLLAAMVVQAAERGYADTTVSDVIALAGVSRATFYQLFDNRMDCLAAAVEEIAAAAEAELLAALDGGGPSEERLRGCFHALVALTVRQPAAARVCAIEAPAAGPPVAGRVESLARTVARRAIAVLREDTDRAALPPDVARAILGGLRKVVESRVHARRERELLDVADDLLDWALGYRSPPAPLRPDALAAPAVPPPAAAHAPRERIHRAVVATVGDRGYQAATVSDIARAANTSLTTFYRLFGNKEAASNAALDDLIDGLYAVALAAYQSAPDWPLGIRDAIAAILASLAADPAGARFAAVAAWGGERPALARLDAGMAGFHAPLVVGLRRRRAPAIASEAIGAAILALVYDTLLREGPERLPALGPAAVFVALAPTVGAIEACAVANGD